MLYLFDPESCTAIENESGRIVYNIDKDKIYRLLVGNKIISGERSEFAFIPSMLDIVEMHFEKNYNRFIDVVRFVVGSDSVFLRMWENERATIKEKDFDRHQSLGIKRVEAMRLCWNKLRENFIKDPIIIEYNWMKSTLENLNNKNFSAFKPDLSLNLLVAKNDMFVLYKTMMNGVDFNSMNEVATKTINQRGYITNLFGRRLYNKDNPIERISKYTDGATNCFLGWLIYSSLYDYCTYVGGEISALLDGKQTTVSVNKATINVHFGIIPISEHDNKRQALIEHIKTPSIIKTTIGVEVL